MKNTSNKERIFVCNCGREINVIGYEREGERQGYAKAIDDVEKIVEQSASSGDMSNSTAYRVLKEIAKLSHSHPEEVGVALKDASGSDTHIRKEKKA